MRLDCRMDFFKIIVVYSGEDGVLYNGLHLLLLCNVYVFNAICSVPNMYSGSK